MAYEFLLVDSLTKVFPEQKPEQASFEKITLCKGEIFNFQLAHSYRVESANSAEETKERVETRCAVYDLEDLRIIVKADDKLRDACKISEVQLVHANLAKFRDMVDEEYLFTEGRLAPDLLMPIKSNIFRPYWDSWRAMWFELNIADTYTAGNYDLILQVEKLDGSTVWEQKIELEILDVRLPEAQLIYTNWFHGDCLADYYAVEVFSERHWEILENFFESAVHNGVNMLLTPIFTPPLDTEIGGERTTIQLVDVTKEADSYNFDFTNFDRWTNLAKKVGIKYFELSHLFTQWGAKACPKIMANVDGELKQIFSWDTPATGEAYKLFLEQFLKALTEHLEQKGILEETYFHVSDEPFLNDLESYVAARDLLRPFVREDRIIDALSNFEFYETGAIRRPIPSNDHIQVFLDNNVEDLWTYYCCAQGERVSNRFMSMPSSRNRIIGVQLYENNIKGFLHWGFNFYNAQFSRYPINPFIVTDSVNAFPSGDAFAVYPAANGEALDSIRSRVFYEALQDIRKFELLESLSSREKVDELINTELSERISFRNYPKGERGEVTRRYLLNLTEMVNEAIKDSLVDIN